MQNKFVSKFKNNLLSILKQQNKIVKKGAHTNGEKVVSMV